MTQTSALKGAAVYSCRATAASASERHRSYNSRRTGARVVGYHEPSRHRRRRRARPERRAMRKRLLAIGCAVIAPLVTVVVGQTASPGSGQTGQPAATSAAPQSPQTPQPSTSPHRALLDRYCVGCHNQRAKASGQAAARKLTLDDLDPARVSEHPDKWELVVRKLRAGMMPPANSRRPDKSTYDGFIT